ncbi:hypothetical protein [Streptomyces filamentosus]|uniref:hypothetical protein n=1 Tax=Streptomyces filamentosus TaxID=67294 RepID=UPI0014788335|nr:hypothetical protein [Streptomyces filamentosus]
MIKSNGKPGASVSDVCPACITDWAPVRWGQPKPYLMSSEAPPTALSFSGAPTWPEKKFA